MVKGLLICVRGPEFYPQYQKIYDKRKLRYVSQIVKYSLNAFLEEGTLSVLREPLLSQQYTTQL